MLKVEQSKFSYDILKITLGSWKRIVSNKKHTKKYIKVNIKKNPVLNFTKFSNFIQQITYSVWNNSCTEHRPRIHRAAEMQMVNSINIAMEYD